VVCSFGGGGVASKSRNASSKSTGCNDTGFSLVLRFGLSFLGLGLGSADMVNAPVVMFDTIRRTTLEYWLQQTGRRIQVYGTPTSRIAVDNYSAGFECKWQNEARNVINDNDWHVPHFCSLGDWASNISDALLDDRYDGLPLLVTYDDYSQLLFRYYTRFLLIISELINDFVDLQDLIQLDTETKDRRQDLSNLLDVSKLAGYINSVCKHKADPQQETNFYHCNHHLPIFFEDSRQICPFRNPITKTKPSVNEPDGVLVPKLSDLVSIVLRGYHLLDDGIRANPHKFETFIRKFGKPLPD
jgi:hypothetical protein